MRVCAKRPMLGFGTTLSARIALAANWPAKPQTKQHIAGMYAANPGRGSRAMAKPADENWKGIPHCRIRADVTSSNAWRILGYPGKSLYTDLRAKLRNGSNGNVSATLGDLKHVGWTSSATLARALYELQSVGFITKTRSGGVERGSKVCSLYAFTDLDINPNPKLGVEKSRATFAYRDFKTVAEARAAMSSGIAKLRDEAIQRKGKTKLKKKIDASFNEAVKAIDASDNEAVGYFPASDNEAVKEYANAA